MPIRVLKQVLLDGLKGASLQKFLAIMAGNSLADAVRKPGMMLLEARR
jgi:hypothetical protein